RHRRRHSLRAGVTAMRRSRDHILTTHTGSLPRPDDLVRLLYAREQGESVDEVAFRIRVREAVADTVRRQGAAGLTVVNDGEMGKVGYSTYVAARLTGFEGEGKRVFPRSADLRAFPEFARSRRGPSVAVRPRACTGPVAYRDIAAVRRDIEDLQAALV